MEPIFLSEQERRDRMLRVYYRFLNSHLGFRRALRQLGEEVSDRPRHPPDPGHASRPQPAFEDRAPSPIHALLAEFAQDWSLPNDVGLLDLWDSLRGGSQRQAGVVGPARRRGLRLRVGDRPIPGVELTEDELEALTPDAMEPPGWRRAGSIPVGLPAEHEAESARDWSDLLTYDPTGIIGDQTRRPRRRRRKDLDPSRGISESRLVANEERLRAQGFARPGPRRRSEDLELGARFLFKRAVCGKTWAKIADEEPDRNVRVDEIVVRMTASRWARELRIPLTRRGPPSE